MPLDNTHQHSSADIMDKDNPHTPISPGGSIPTLAEVLVAGSDPDGNAIQAAAASYASGAALAVLPDDIQAYAGAGINDGSPEPGGSARLRGGTGSEGEGGARVDARGGGYSAPNVGGFVDLLSGAAATGSGAAGGDIRLLPGLGDGAGRNGLVFLNLPTSDPGVSGSAFTDGAPSAGVPKPVMVSGG